MGRKERKEGKEGRKNDGRRSIKRKQNIKIQKKIKKPHLGDKSKKNQQYCNNPNRDGGPCGLNPTEMEAHVALKKKKGVHQYTIKNINKKNNNNKHEN